MATKTANSREKLDIGSKGKARDRRASTTTITDNKDITLGGIQKGDRVAIETDKMVIQGDVVSITADVMKLRYFVSKDNTVGQGPWLGSSADDMDEKHEDVRRADIKSIHKIV